MTQTTNKTTTKTNKTTAHEESSERETLSIAASLGEEEDEDEYPEKEAELLALAMQFELDRFKAALAADPDFVPTLKTEMFRERVRVGADEFLETVVFGSEMIFANWVHDGKGDADDGGDGWVDFLPLSSDYGGLGLHDLLQLLGDEMTPFLRALDARANA